jgi:hypothetical protein
MCHFIKKLLAFCSPFILLVLIYIITDPFMVIYNYDDYNRKPYIQKNRDYVSSEMFIGNSEKYLYDSFIFGSSTALYIPPSIWRNYISTENYIYTFDASGENLIGVWSKIKYLDSHNHQIKNVLLVVDFNLFSEFDNSDPTYMKHYEIYPSSMYNFQYKYFLQFMNPEFFFALTHYTISKKFYPYMNKALISYEYRYDTITNEYYNIGIDKLLKTDSLEYYKKRSNKFKIRSSEYTEEDKIITSKHIQVLNDIRTIFTKHFTEYKIVIGPSYNQIAFNKEDIVTLQTIFGKENVFDFSGINRFSADQSNFYDGIHFKKYVGKELLDSAYSIRIEY